MASEDVRKMRQERAAAQRRKSLPAKAGKRILIAVVIVVAIAGIVYAVQQSAERRGSCPGHWHATFAIYVDGERVPFPQPPYQLAPQGKMAMSMHMHSPSQEILHYEPVQPECLGTEDAFNRIDVDLGSDKMILDSDHENGPLGGTYENDGNSTLRYFVQPKDSTLEETSWSKLKDRQLANGEKLLIAYGAYSEAEIQSMMDRIATPP